MHTAKEKGDENMIRIEILFTARAQKTSNQAHFRRYRMKSTTSETTLPGNLAAYRPGQRPSVSVTGARNDKDKERILSLWKKSGRTTAGCLQHEYRLSPPADPSGNDSYVRPLFADRCRPVFLRLPLIMLSRNWI